MEKYVIKRNGDYKPFQSYKIKDAIEKSFASVSVPYDKSVFENVIKIIKNKDTWAVEEIQDIIEKMLFQKIFCSNALVYVISTHAKIATRAYSRFK